MLVLSRKLGEKIYIGDNICITVVDPAHLDAEADVPGVVRIAVRSGQDLITA